MTRRDVTVRLPACPGLVDPFSGVIAGLDLPPRSLLLVNLEIEQAGFGRRGIRRLCDCAGFPLARRIPAWFKTIPPAAGRGHDGQDDRIGSTPGPWPPNGRRNSGGR
jgi:hypothetical protein